MIFDLQLIRHGMTHANEMGLYYGETDIPLSEKGIADVIEKKNSGIYRKTKKYYISGKQRAKETATLIFGNVPFTTISELSEWNFGKFEMKSHEELLSDPDYVKFIADDDGLFVCPGGESRITFNERIKKGFSILFEDMINNNISSSTLVAHGGTLAMFVMNYCPEKGSFYDALPSYAEGYNALLDYENGKITIKNIVPIKGITSEFNN